MKKEYYYLLLPIIYFGLLIIYPLFSTSLTVEDGIVENIGAIAFFIASLLFVFKFLESKKEVNNFFGKRTQRNIVFAFLAVLFFVAAGEEISWGQRIFGWETPESISAINAQNEINIHNIWFFHGFNEDGTDKSFFMYLFNANRLFSICCMIFCVLIPLAVRYSYKAKQFFQFIGVPIAPLWAGGLFVANQIIFYFFQFNYGQYIDYDVFSFVEVKESILALISMVIAYHYPTYTVSEDFKTASFLKTA